MGSYGIYIFATMLWRYPVDTLSPATSLTKPDNTVRPTPDSHMGSRNSRYDVYPLPPVAYCCQVMKHQSTYTK